MKHLNIIIALLLLASVIVNVWIWKILRQHPEVRIETRTEYVTIRDTVPTIAESRLTGETVTVTAKIKHHVHALNHQPDVLPSESKPDTVATVCIIGDSATLTLPVEQRVYEDSLYTAYVSGYRPRLDSISLRLPHTYKTITRTASTPSRRWAVGPTVGAGYGIAGKRADVFVGVGVMWNILP